MAKTKIIERIIILVNLPLAFCLRFKEEAGFNILHKNKIYEIRRNINKDLYAN